MSDIKMYRLDLDATDHFYECNHLMSLHFKGLTILYDNKVLMEQ